VASPFIPHVDSWLSHESRNILLFIEGPSNIPFHFKGIGKFGLFTIVVLSSLALIAPSIPRGGITFVVDLVGETTQNLMHGCCHFVPCKRTPPWNLCHQTLFVSFLMFLQQKSHGQIFCSREHKQKSIAWKSKNTQPPLLGKTNQGEWHALVGLKYYLIVIVSLTFSILSC